MSTRLKLILIALLLTAVSCAALVDAGYPLGIIWSMIHGWTSIPYWIGMGFSKEKALFTVILFGVISVAIKFWFADELFRLGKKFFPRKNSAPSKAKFRFYRLARKFPYIILFASLFYPGSVWVGIGIAKVFKLSNPLSLAILILGSSLKLLLMGTGVVSLVP